jgi:hypothetical protein
MAAPCDRMVLDCRPRRLFNHARDLCMAKSRSEKAHRRSRLYQYICCTNEAGQSWWTQLAASGILVKYGFAVHSSSADMTTRQRVRFTPRTE